MSIVNPHNRTELVMFAGLGPVGVPVYLSWGLAHLGVNVRLVGPTRGSIWPDAGAGPSFDTAQPLRWIDPGFHQSSFSDRVVFDRSFCGTVDVVVYDGDDTALRNVRHENVSGSVLLVTDPHVRALSTLTPMRNQRVLSMQRHFVADPGRTPLVEHGNFGYATMPCRLSIATQEPTHDVSMIGAPYEKRVRIAQALEEAGLSVLHPSRGYYGDDYFKMLAAGRVVLVPSLAGDTPARVYEANMAGRPVVTDALEVAWNNVELASTFVKYRQELDVGLWVSAAKDALQTFKKFESRCGIEFVVRRCRQRAFQRTWIHAASDLLSLIG